ncbi:ribonuclease HI [Rhodovarius crocodyli]|uniref:ribonuclease H n=1 Tax=Rhodovarius crocodyli TaxID=1979269 RepID=A0A437M1X3_9PROT|nr:ribonuclease H [Rhodovarius crocodyli]RVT91688.1 ribonuclease HI [Rhodovarius crocodyli]
MTLSSPDAAKPPMPDNAPPSSSLVTPAGPISVWIGGACQPNPGCGAWAAVTRDPDGDVTELSGHHIQTTNNRMELYAAIRALEALSQLSDVTVHSDSEYVSTGARLWLRKWKACRWRNAKGKAVLNRDLWQRLSFAIDQHIVTWCHAPRGEHDPMGERVSRLVFKGVRRADAIRRQRSYLLQDEVEF